MTTVGLAISSLLIPLSWILKRLTKIRDWLDRKLKWNWTIRLLMESLMELSFGTIITISYAKGSTFGSYFNLGFAYALFIAMCSLPFFSQIFYQLQFKRMSDLEDKEFDNKYGAPYEGLKQDKRWSLFHPFMLCVRRISFMYLILNHYKNPLL